MRYPCLTISKLIIFKCGFAGKKYKFKSTIEPFFLVDRFQSSLKIIKNFILAPKYTLYSDKVLNNRLLMKPHYRTGTLLDTTRDPH